MTLMKYFKSLKRILDNSSKEGVKYMVHIAACDDDSTFLDQITAMLSELAGKLDLSFETFSNAPDLLCAIEQQHNRFNIILLDISINTHNGIDVSKRIRKYNENVIIIFITSFLEYAPDGYEVKAFRYILKPIKYDILKSEIEAAIDELEKNKVETFSVTAKGIYKTVAVNDILYFESQNRVLLIKDVGGNEIVFYGKLDEIEKLDIFTNFIRAHQSFLVNIRHINYIDKKGKAVILKTNYKIPISRSKIDLVIKKYIAGLKRI
jgi:DNA-binding LytR/AlgR family response regulator